MSESLLKRSLLHTTMLAALAYAGPAFAQTQPTEPDPVEQTPVETVTDVDAEGEVVPVPATEIVVTGTRVRRPDLENATPTTVVGEELFEVTNATNFADVANNLPQFTPSYGTSRTQSTFSGAAASGLQLVNLRNLGGQRTLTLINGRRMPGGTTTSSSVDFNTIPSANIDRVEIITGGASAIYGADAVAGVVNIITRSNFEGAEMGASYRITRHGDDATPQAYLMFGTQIGDGGHAVVTGEVTKQGIVVCRDRFICAEDFFWNPGAAGTAAPIRGPAAQSGVSAFGRFFIPDNPNIPGDQSGSVIRDLTPFNVSVHGFNRNAVRTLAQDTERFMIASEASYPIFENVELFTELNYGLARTQANFEGHPFQSQAAGSLFGGGPGTPGLQATIPIYIPSAPNSGLTCTSLAAGCMFNPIVPVALRNQIFANDATASQITWWQRFGEEGTTRRGAENERQMFRGMAGVRGEINLGLPSSWTWEVNYLYGQTTLNSLTGGLVSTGALYYGLRTEPDPNNPGGFRCQDVGARTSGCIPINPFDGFSDAEADSLNVTAGQSGRSIIQNFQAFMAGDLLTLPGGDLGVAFGVEKRVFSGFLDYDEVINRGLVTGNQIGDTELSRRSTKDVFVEAVAPIIGDMPFLHRLTLEGAYRLSDPSVGDNYKTWRYGGTAEFMRGLKVRAMRARAVREPQPGELGGIGQSFGVINDPCFVENRNANPTRAANCTADGVPANYDPPLVVRQATGGFVGGNPDLEPEVGTTLTYGMVFAPTSDGPLGFLNGLSLTVDRFEIEMEKVVNTVGRQLKATLCYDTVERLFCNDLVRASHPLVVGNVFLRDVNDQLINIATLETNGWDLEARYSRPIRLLSPSGRIALQALATRYTKANFTPLPGQTPTNLLGFAGGDTSLQGYPKWTGNGMINYRQGGTSLTWNMRYIGKTKSAHFAPAAWPGIDAHWYHNFRFAQQVGERYQFQFGINNVFDKDPPFFPTGTSGTQALDTVPAYYDVFGRSYYAGFRVNF